MADELYRHGATEEQVDAWLRGLNDAYALGMGAALEVINDQVLERAEPAGSA
jgi:hypothetical protein